MAKVSNPVLSMEARGSIGQVSTYRQMGGASVVNAKRRLPTIDNSLAAIRRKFLYGMKSKIIATIKNDDGRGGLFDTADNVLISHRNAWIVEYGANWENTVRSDTPDTTILSIVERLRDWTPIDPTHWFWEIPALNPEFRSVHNAQGLTAVTNDPNSDPIFLDAWQVTIGIREIAFILLQSNRFIEAAGTTPNFDRWTTGLYTTNPLDLDGAELARVRARLRDR